MNFLFDVINDISGYTQKYYDETMETLNHDALVKKYRNEKNRYENDENKKIEDSALLGDLHPHSLLVLESIQELLKMPGSNIRV